MNLVIDIENACGNDDVPDEPDIRRWLTAAFAALPDSEQRNDVELSLRLVDETESQALNQRYRNQNKPTNVLSFPSQLPAELQLPLLGDLAICTPVVEREASEQGKTAAAHWAHMVVHGTLHLLGYDHIDDADAEAMEALESRILIGLGFDEPYEPNHTTH
ncbi:rRNA maturation RNase YbeY [bacterium SCSIO 12696]|nr:rRNA maturation RNase YbeY [bacterium SCSIO 12696]